MRGTAAEIGEAAAPGQESCFIVLGPPSFSARGLEIHASPARSQLRMTNACPWSRDLQLCPRDTSSPKMAATSQGKGGSARGGARVESPSWLRMRDGRGPAAFFLPRGASVAPGQDGSETFPVGALGPGQGHAQGSSRAVLRCYLCSAPPAS